jgi:hypothetical protein
VWVIVRQEDWVGGEDVLGAVGTFATKREAELRQAGMQEVLNAQPVVTERLWLVKLDAVG